MKGNKDNVIRIYAWNPPPARCERGEIKKLHWSMGKRSRKIVNSSATLTEMVNLIPAAESQKSWKSIRVSSSFRREVSNIILVFFRRSYSLLWTSLTGWLAIWNVTLIRYMRQVKLDILIRWTRHMTSETFVAPTSAEKDFAVTQNRKKRRKNEEKREIHDVADSGERG